MSKLNQDLALRQQLINDVGNWVKEVQPIVEKKDGICHAITGQMFKRLFPNGDQGPYNNPDDRILQDTYQGTRTTPFHMEVWTPNEVEPGQSPTRKSYVFVVDNQTGNVLESKRIQGLKATNYATAFGQFYQSAAEQTQSVETKAPAVGKTDAKPSTTVPAELVK